MSKMEKIFASLDKPVSDSSDNGPPFNVKAFSDSKYLGFRKEPKMPLNSQANQGRVVHDTTAEAAQSKQRYPISSRNIHSFVPTKRRNIAPPRLLR